MHDLGDFEGIAPQHQKVKSLFLISSLFIQRVEITVNINA